MSENFGASDFSIFVKNGKLVDGEDNVISDLGASTLIATEAAARAGHFAAMMAIDKSVEETIHTSGKPKKQS